ncbi:hypothetical protein ACFYT4_31780 [Streptomyces sp. NPDC004609]|uniref:hypothetical protein n=1 Tax=Streptomyces sp. NPDC004609 TaxID=3364704 RepID=UPI00368DBCE8
MEHALGIPVRRRDDAQVLPASVTRRPMAPRPRPDKTGAFTPEWELLTADLVHNTLCKPYVEIPTAEAEKVKGMLAEAAAFDQEEIRRSRWTWGRSHTMST